MKSPIPTASSSAREAERFTRTDDLARDLAGRTVRSGAIQLSTQALTLVLFVASGMVLARLLVPADFGVYAMAMTVVGFVANLKDYGLIMAAVHEERLDEGRLSALFWLSLRLNLLTVVALIAFGPALAWFFEEPDLIAVTAVMALALFVLGLGHQHESVLIRRLEFGPLRVIEIGALVGGIAVAVVAAAAGAGAWALVAQFATVAVLRTAGLWWSCGWRPARGSRAGIGGLAAYGRHVTLFRVLTHVARHLDRVLIGRFAGAAVLGLYDNALRWALYPVTQVYAPLTNLVVSALSRCRTDARRYRAAWRRCALSAWGLVVPALAFLALEADPAIRVLLGERWIPAVPFFRVLCIAGVGASIERVLKWIYLSQGNTERQLRWAMVYAPLMVVAVATGLRWGAYGVAVGFAAGTWVALPGAVAYCLGASELRWRDFAAALGRPAAASVVALAAPLAAASPLRPLPALPELAASLLLYLAAYVVAWIALPGGRAALADLAGMLREALVRTPVRAPAESGVSES